MAVSCRLYAHFMRLSIAIQSTIQRGNSILDERCKERCIFIARKKEREREREHEAKYILLWSIYIALSAFAFQWAFSFLIITIKRLIPFFVPIIQLKDTSVFPSVKQSTIIRKKLAWLFEYATIAFLSIHKLRLSLSLFLC